MMTTAPRSDKPSETLLFLTDAQVRRGIEALFFAYRSFTHSADAVLAQYDLGRAHHRALHFIGTNAGITVNELLVILGISKQSLNRVLRRLIDDGIVLREVGRKDKRARHLHLSERGVSLFRKVSAIQEEQMRDAYRDAGADAVLGFRRVLWTLMKADARASFEGTGGDGDVKP